MSWDDFALAFFSLDILRQAWPILLSGLVQTLLLSAMVVPLGLLVFSVSSFFIYLRQNTSLSEN